MNKENLFSRPFFFNKEKLLLKYWEGMGLRLTLDVTVGHYYRFITLGTCLSLCLQKDLEDTPIVSHNKHRCVCVCVCVRYGRSPEVIRVFGLAD